MNFRYRMETIGVIAGAAAGWCYWYFVGCSSGSCPITSRWEISTLYGAVMGALAFSALPKGQKKDKLNKQ